MSDSDLTSEHVHNADGFCLPCVQHGSMLEQGMRLYPTRDSLVMRSAPSDPCPVHDGLCGASCTGRAAECGECKAWPGHHPDCSLYGIPRTEAGARLLATLENSIYRGTSPAIVARAAITEIEDEAEVRAANRGVRVTGDAGPCDRCGKRPRVEAHYGLCCDCIVPFDNECHPEGTDQVYAKGYAAGYADGRAAPPSDPAAPDPVADVLLVREQDSPSDVEMFLRAAVRSARETPPDRPAPPSDASPLVPHVHEDGQACRGGCGYRPLFTEAEAPRSLTSYVDEWMAQQPLNEIIELNLRVFAVWADAKYRAALTGAPE